MRGLGVVVIALAACGRLGFEPIASTGDDGDDAAIDARLLDDGAPEPDGFPGGPGVRCGQVVCLMPDRCCQVFGPACQAPGALCEGFYYNCDGPEDCAAGEVCCQPGLGTGCTAASSCTAGDTVICHDDLDCPPGETCCPGGNYRACAATCP